MFVNLLLIQSIGLICKHAFKIIKPKNARKEQSNPIFFISKVSVAMHTGSISKDFSFDDTLFCEVYKYMNESEMQAIKNFRIVSKIQRLNSLFYSDNLYKTIY